jgi:hypothetical protein
MPRTLFRRDRLRMICEPSSLTAAPPTMLGVAALRHDRHAVLGAEPHRLGDLPRCRRAATPPGVRPR